MAMAASTSQPLQVYFRKRSNPNGSDNEGPNIKTTKDSATSIQGYYYVLESESDPPTDEDTESIYSLQGKPTDSAKDTSDLSYSDDSNIVYTIGGNTAVFTEEYEPAPLSESENLVPDILSSASDGENIKTTCEVMLFIQDEDTWADDSSSSTSECEHTVDPEISLRDYWSCVQCKATNNNPLFRYCERCFKIRKNFFPPRPKQKKKKKQRKRTSRKKDNKKNLRSYETNKNCPTPNNVKGEIFDKNLKPISNFPTRSQNSSNSECMTPENALNNLKDSNYFSQSSGSTILLNSQSSELSSSSNNHNLSSFNTPDSLNSFGNDEASSYKDVRSNSYNNGCIDSEISFKTNEIANLNTNRDSSLCQTCLTRPKDGLFVHGRKLGHMFCCYECSKKVWKKTGRCPLCNCKVNQVLKVIS